MRSTSGNNSKFSTYRLALGGVCTALTAVCVFLASVVPGVELTLYALSSIFAGIVIIESGPRDGVIVYIATLILCFILVPNKIAVVPYACFFGLYGIIKYYAELIKNKIGQIAVKVILFGAVFGIAYAFFRNIFFGNIKLPDYSIIAIAIGGVILFILYDLIYTLILNLYLSRFKNVRKSGEAERAKQSKTVDGMKLYREPDNGDDAESSQMRGQDQKSKEE